MGCGIHFRRAMWRTSMGTFIRRIHTFCTPTLLNKSVARPSGSVPQSLWYVIRINFLFTETFRSIGYRWSSV